ncbi:MAG TPA: phosphoenolpyruvate synthase [Polyangia bacterium]|nr:phosphoenolpyruvate synthase [Polyangia bacterium]
MSSKRLIIPFRDVDLTSLPEVGGKNASIGELTRALTSMGVRVPDGFAITASAFRDHLAQGGVDRAIYAELDRLDTHDVDALARAGAFARARVRELPLPRALEIEISAAYDQLSHAFHDTATDVAVRSSATAEDLPSASFAGQHESYLNVRGRAALLAAVRECMASLFNDRAIAYRAERGFAHRDVALSVGVQKMVRSDLASAGVIFTLDTESGHRGVVTITGSWGLGESVVKGRVNPDETWVFKKALAEGRARPIIRRQCGDKAHKLIYGPKDADLIETPVADADRRRLVLDDGEAVTLARWAVAIEEHYSARAGRPTPMDIEWAKDGRSGQLFIVQARPETVHSQRGSLVQEVFHVQGGATVLARGKSVGARVAAGRARVIRSAQELATFQDGEILVAPSTDPDWEPALERAAAVVTEQGGRTCHAAIVSRELGLPCVVGTGDATTRIETGRVVTVSCAEGDEGRVYDGSVPFRREELDATALGTPRVPVMLNVGDPRAAFGAAALPSAGVGLARIEFIVSSAIGVHPMALLHPERLEASVAEAVRARAAAAPTPAEFFVSELANGVAQIAAAFHPRPVIVRFSDFKTNEYANLLGGQPFEPIEDNPMIGFRGASRYYDERYREAFALECAAIRRVRTEMGLPNVKVMIPFCRTLGEGERVLAELAKNGLVRGEDGLEVYVMCEIPNNVILAKEFAALFDGFSIGSNDLTQLTLGVDRDSELLAHLFDERDPGVEKLIEMVTTVAHAAGRKVGLCGQAPSDHPEFATFLADVGLDSISVTADALPDVVRRLATAK